MAKTVKFNLRCNGNSVRTLSDLRENFVIEEVLDYFDSGLLLRWLEVREYETEAEKLRELAVRGDSLSLIGKAEELIMLFGIESEESRIREAVIILQHRFERQEFLRSLQEHNYSVGKMLESIMQSYDRLIGEILERPGNLPLIKANIKTLAEEHMLIFTADYRNVFYTFRRRSLTALMCLLMNKDTRPFFVPEHDGSWRSVPEYSSASYSDVPGGERANLYQELVRLLSDPRWYKEIEQNVSICSDKTGGYWKSIGDGSDKFMIISAGFEDAVRSADGSSGELSYEDIRCKFRILDGIEYRSGGFGSPLIYMEV